jgi:hypothetical protein
MGLAISAFAGLFGTARISVNALRAAGPDDDWNRSSEFVPIAFTEPPKTGQPPSAQGVPNPGPTTIDANALVLAAVIASNNIPAVVIFIIGSPHL